MDQSLPGPLQHMSRTVLHVERLPTTVKSHQSSDRKITENLQILGNHTGSMVTGEVSGGNKEQTGGHDNDNIASPYRRVQGSRVEEGNHSTD